MHPRNRYQGHYDLTALFALEPSLKKWESLTPAGKVSFNFSEPEAVKSLNKALLKQWYQLEWTLPDDHLCPPIPGRADYIHHLADCLAEDIPSYQGPQITILDIGCGANCIYPLIGNAEYQWRFTGSDCQPESLRAAQHLLTLNKGLTRSIRLRRQKDQRKVFDGIIHPNEFYHATLCNPPFHPSSQAAAEGTARKNKHLGIAEKQLNFAGRYHELWCPGGEIGFITQMIEESVLFQHQVLWFTTLVAKQQSLGPLKKLLKEKSVPVVKEIEMGQGNKKSRLLIWSFHNKRERKGLVKPA
ncbi:23S rRNA (adenine(1618)-N(6))-methyltransferase RlmF [Tatumella ptyseos]|uniref:23S rRNA (adenine(1618)-N(6))-methyltransferase RlmF n=1 Tax=Tatumella ptyseos TaxID=82987 RepID=UPI0026EE2B68|nr:23S rRNA (adenine(1618)-N(6))-methyltransferase RlmF [Tatumella ptyseos]WKX27543.1 23S rRNA (adenine(1618)-N(6))-methyltransferase RlmF [Tatumella ptyseos]